MFVNKTYSLTIPHEIARLGCWPSIVVPDFAEEWYGDLQEVSVNRHSGAGVWEELSREAVSMLFEVR